jgi:hypothetical protein
MAIGRGWKKGQSGNPGGRPKAFYALAKLIHAETRNGAELVERVLKIARGQDTTLDDPKSRTWALDWLSDRGFGKPQQDVVVMQDEHRPIDYDALTDEQLEALGELDAANPAEPATVLRLVPVTALTGGDGSDGEPGAS